MADYTRKSGTCRNCKITTEARLHHRIRANGSRAFQWVCAKCNAQDPFKTGMFIANEKVLPHFTEEAIEELPRLMPDAVNRCVMCGERKAEMHHWAPRAIFGGECEQWPKDYLCKPCHDKWHVKVTPQLVGGAG